MPEKGLNKRARLQALRDAYSAGLGGRLADIEAGWALLRREPDNVDRHSELHRQVHSLAGSAATFGYRQLGRLARDLEQLLSAAVDGTTLTTAAQNTDIPARLAELRTVSERGPDEPLTPEVSPATRRRTEPGQVYVIEDDPQQAAETATQLGAYGWQVTTFANAAEALARLRHTLPAALVVDQVLSEGELAGSSLLEQVEAVAEYRVPRIVVSSRRDWQSRLAAARAGADAYLVKPLDFSELAATLDTLTDRHEREPYRVLIVDDTVDLAEHYAEVLGSAGMQVKVINEPAGLLDTLTEFRPELILMDLYMPGCSGIEAARVIRQEPEYLSVPIVFLSTEAGRERQLAAMETGADDFLEKPIADDQLIAVVKIRAKRFRSLAEQINRDSLTGLLNHISFKLQLEAELSRTLRADSPLTLAMLDIDHFKRVNDSYGHPVGDRVIRGVAALLTKRLRKSDLIGRYGGEEFAVVMPDTDLDAALGVLDQLRELCAQIVYSSGAQEFNCTISIGTASSRDYTEMETLIRAADGALYAAKRGGRNRVRSAPAPHADQRQSGAQS